MPKPKARTVTPAATRAAQRPLDPLGVLDKPLAPPSAVERGIEAIRTARESRDARAALEVRDTTGAGVTPSMNRRPRTGTAPPPRPDGGAAA